MSLRESLTRRLPQKLIGVALTVVAAGYMGRVALDHGVINPDRPKTHEQVHTGMVGFYAERQDSESIASEAKGGGDMALKILMEQLSREVDGRIEVHKRLVTQRERAPEGHSTDLRKFFATAAQELPPECNVSIDDVTPRTVLYRGTESVELLCSSSIPAERLFDQYVEKMVDLKWLVQFPGFDSRTRRGILIAEREGYTLFIRVDESETFPGSQTFVYWLLESNKLPGGEMNMP